MARVEAEEAAVLAPEMARLRAEADDLAAELDRVEGENERLAQLMAQQQALVADTRRFLDELERRRASILDGLARIARGPLPVEETVHGRLIGLTPRGWFHIQRLHLNRPHLVERRHLRNVLRAQNADLSRAREAESRLRRENEVLQGEIARLRAAVSALLRGGER